MTQVSGDMTSGEMTLGRFDCKPSGKGNKSITGLQDYRITGLQQDKFGLINWVATIKSFKADALSVSLSSERMTKG